MKDNEKIKVWEDFINEYGSYIIDFDIKWINMFEKLKLFIIKYKRTPNSRSSEETEKDLANWFHNQKLNYKNKKDSMKEETRRKIWENFMEEFKDYIIDFDIIWTDNYLQCKNFIENNKRRPISCSKNKEERQLGNWIIKQNTNYKKTEGAMKDNCKRMLWENFMEEFKEYFD
jgi:hypothetical protein